MILHIWHHVISWCKDACHNCVLLQIIMENNIAVNMEGWQQCALFVWRHKPNILIFLSFESSSNNLLDKFQLVDFQIAFLIASLRIDEWWISSQNHNLANLFVVFQSTNSISSRGHKTTFWAWTSAILVLKLSPWWSMQERVFYYQFGTAIHSLLS